MKGFEVFMKRLSVVVGVLAVAVLLALPQTIYGNNQYEAQGGGDKVSKRKVSSLVSEFRHKQGVEVIDLGWMGTSLLKGAARVASWAGENVEPEVLALLKGLNGITVLSFEDSSSDIKGRITRKISEMLKGAELLMEIKDAEQRMSIYGSVDKAGRLRDVVLYAPEDGALICLFGSFGIEEIAKLSKDGI